MRRYSAVLDLVKKNDLHPDQVAKVQIRSLARAADILSDPSKYDPHTKETADHSLPYVIAAALVDRQVTPAQFEMAKIMDPKIREQLKKVEVVADPEIEECLAAGASLALGLGALSKVTTYIYAAPFFLLLGGCLLSKAVPSPMRLVTCGWPGSSAAKGLMYVSMSRV